MKKAALIALIYFSCTHTFNYKIVQSMCSAGKTYLTHIQSNYTGITTKMPQFKNLFFSKLSTLQSLLRNRFSSNTSRFNRLHSAQRTTGLLLTGAGVSAALSNRNRVCYASEETSLPLSRDEIKDPIKLQAKLAATPIEDRPQLAVEIIRYLGTYLTSYRWRWALASAISMHPEIAIILVHFLIQYPAEITQHAAESVGVIEFLMSQNKTVAEPICNCIRTNKSILTGTTFGPEIIQLAENTQSAYCTTNPNNRVIES